MNSLIFSITFPPFHIYSAFFNRPAIYVGKCFYYNPYKPKISERSIIMWVKETPEGTYKFTERFKNALTGKYKSYSITFPKNTAASRKEALAILQSKYTNDFMFSSADFTLSQLREIYLSSIKSDVKLSTYQRNFHSTLTSINILGPDVLASELTAGYIKKMYKDSGKESTTINELVIRFKAWMNWCYKNDYIRDISFLKKIDRLKSVSTKEKLVDKFLEEDEAKRIIIDLEERGLHAHSFFAEFMLNSGLRAGELIALEKKDIDKARGVIRITKTYDTINKLVTTPKTFSSIREIPLTPKLNSLIVKINKYYRVNKLSALSQTTLFKNPTTGSYYQLPAFNKALSNSCKRLGIDKKITSHALRHTYASLLMEKGIQIDVISRLLGHDNSKITREIYLHVTEKLKEKDFNLIRQINIL